MPKPSPNGSNGRDGRGRFAQGNAGGPGNPHAGKVAQWRTVLVDTVSREDIEAVIRALVEAAKAGERWAVCELLDRCLGKPTQAVEAVATDLPGEVVLKLEFDQPLAPRARPASVIQDQ